MVDLDSAANAVDIHDAWLGEEIARCERCNFVDIVFTREHVRGSRGSRGDRGQRGHCKLLCRNCIEYLDARRVGAL